jgi:hypothetical protein
MAQPLHHKPRTFAKTGYRIAAGRQTFRYEEVKGVQCVAASNRQNAAIVIVWLFRRVSKLTTIADIVGA